MTTESGAYVGEEATLQVSDPDPDNSLYLTDKGITPDSSFDERTRQMGLEYDYTALNNDSESSNFVDHYSEAKKTPVKPGIPTGLNRFTDDGEEEDEEELVTDGEEDGSGYVVTRQDRRKKEKATFNPSAAVGRDDTYVDTIRSANLDRSVARVSLKFDSTGDAELGEKGDDDQGRVGDIAYTDVEDPSTISAIDVANNAGKYDKDRIVEDAESTYKVTAEEGEQITRYEVAAPIQENIPYSEQSAGTKAVLLDEPAGKLPSIDYDKTVKQLLPDGINTETRESDSDIEGVRVEYPEAQQAQSISDRERQAILDRIIINDPTYLTLK